MKPAPQLTEMPQDAAYELSDMMSDRSIHELPVMTIIIGTLPDIGQCTLIIPAAGEAVLVPAATATS